MKELRNIVIIPGFGETKNDKAYKIIQKELTKNGYNIIFYQPKWKRNTIDKWIKDFEVFTKQLDTQNTILLGFSFGAYISLLAGLNNKYKKILLCSLSPYFKNDIEKLPKIAYKILGKRRIEAFKKNDFPENINTPLLFFVGDKDIKLVINRTINAHNKYSDSKLIIVKGAEHDLNNISYINEIKKALS